MKNINLIFLFLCISVYGQSKVSISDVVNTAKQISGTVNRSKDKLDKFWFSTRELEFIVSNDVVYNHGNLDNNGKLVSGNSIKLNEKVSYGVLYSINYPILNKLTLGVVGGFQHQILPKITSLKIGGILRYYFVDYENVNLYTLTAYNISLKDYINSGMANLRFGLTFPIKKLESINLTLNLFWDYNFYNARKPIFYGINEKPGDFTYRAYGISLGMKF